MLASQRPRWVRSRGLQDCRLGKWNPLNVECATWHIDLAACHALFDLSTCYPVTPRARVCRIYD